jgi:hypothetical protein
MQQLTATLARRVTARCGEHDRIGNKVLSFGSESPTSTATKMFPVVSEPCLEEINTHAKINSKSGSRLECLNQKGIFMSLRRWSFLPLGFELKFHQSFEYPNRAVAEVSFLHIKT